MRRKAATIGFFDGVHLGHLCLIQQLKKVAQGIDAGPVIVTMWPHPQAVLQPKSRPELLTTLDEKLDLLHRSGVGRVEILPFDLELSSLSARVFMADVLRGRLGIDTLVMGYDHRFGHGGGTMAQYAEWGRELGIEVIQAVPLQGEHVSSSAIRRRLEAGEVEAAAAMLGRPYELGGTVVDGYKVGRTLGFPTANLLPQEGKLVPRNGVYAVWVILPDDTRYKGMLNIGNRPTLDGETVSIEVNLLGFNGDLYHQPLRLLFMHRLRDEVRFASLEGLQAQLRRDAEEADRLL